MGTVKKTSQKLNKRRCKGVKTQSNYSEIDDLIEDEFCQVSERARKEEEEKNASLQLVNEFIQNETRNSFKRKGKRKVRAKQMEQKEENIEGADTQPDSARSKKTSKLIQSESAKGTKSKTKKHQKEKWEDFDENSPYAQDLIKEKSATKTKKRSNKVLPSVKPDALEVVKPSKKSQTKKQSVDIERIENSCMTIVMMAFTLDGEYPPEFYNKLMCSNAFQIALKKMNNEQKSLILAMLGDMEPPVDYLPIQNEIFLENMKDYLSVPT